jgi:mono/diheme cytochrome c family protein
MRTCLRNFSGLLAVILVAAGSAGAADLTKEKVVFDQKCAMCHAKDLTGNPAMAKMFKLDQSALSLVKKETLGKKDADLVAITTNGQGKMPAFKGKLSDEEISDLVAYIRSLAPKQ